MATHQRGLLMVDYGGRWFGDRIDKASLVDFCVLNIFIIFSLAFGAT